MSCYYTLKPCPFCGGKAIFSIISNVSTHTEIGYEYTIKCSKCGCSPFKEITKINVCMSEKDGSLYATSETQVRQQELVKVWNTRTLTEKGGD